MRPSCDEYFMQLAMVVSTRSTCQRRSVGCVLVDARNQILATGYNGVVSGALHCNEGYHCPGAHAKSGSSLDSCYAVHAEQNALIQCKNVQDIHKLYTTCEPCHSCMKLLLNTNCKDIVYLHPYEGSSNERVEKAWFVTSSRTWRQLDDPKATITATAANLGLAPS